MAVKKDEGVAVLARPEAEATTVAPVLVVPQGRGKGGKSVFARYIIEAMRAAGREVVAADFDRTNPTLSSFMADAVRPESAAPEDVKRSMARLIETQIEKRHSVVLDMGGGDLALKDFTREVPLVEFLGGYGIEPIAVHLIGPDIDDLAYLQDVESDGLFAPKRTLLVVNAGVVPNGRAADTAFAPVMEHPIFRSAVARGAESIVMPRLPCMADLEAGRVSFADAEAGSAKLGPTRQFMVTKWRRDMAAALAPVAGWFA
jgi:hypothetical protein